MDHTLDGEPLPRNIFWVAAINPNDTTDKTDNKKKEKVRAEEFNFTGIKGTEKEFAVRPPPPSMRDLILDFNALEEEQEEVFLRVCIFALSGMNMIIYNFFFLFKVLFAVRTDLGTEKERETLKQYILMGQQFVRSAAISECM